MNHDPRVKGQLQLDSRVGSAFKILQKNTLLCYRFYLCSNLVPRKQFAVQTYVKFLPDPNHLQRTTKTIQNYIPLSVDCTSNYHYYT